MIAIDISKPFDFFDTKCYHLYEVQIMDFRKENIDIKKINLCCYVDKNNGERIHKNRKYYGLAFHIDGEKKYNFENYGNYFIKPNSVIFMPKYSNYVVDSITTGSCYAISFELFEDIDFPPFSINIKNYTEILENFKKANTVWRRKKAGYEMKCRSYLYNIIYIIQNEYNNYSNTKQLKVIEPALEFIRKNYHLQNEFNVKDLSKLCEISETYFRRLFNDCMGVSPIQYINNLKLTRASELLSSGFYTVSEVMTMSGFNDGAYFSRHFKKHFGVSPKEYSLSNK